jgi:AraC-like DNA-binding protein
MLSHTSPKGATAHLIAPAMGLGACVRAYISRSTIGVDLLPQERYNHFPASPLCGISWFSHGVADVMPGDGRDAAPQRLPAISFFGPHTRPSVSHNPGPAQGFMLLMLPDALHAMTGVDVAAQVDRQSPLHQVLDASWCQMAQAVLQAADDAARVQVIEAFLLPRWQQVRSQGTLPVRSFQDWAQALAVRALVSGAGQSLRQAERRVKAWTGQSLRALQGRSRAEAAFFQVRQAESAGAVVWADLAVDAGYADQSHLCRESRRVTGLSPEALRRRMQDDESFWVYRIWS